MACFTYICTDIFILLFLPALEFFVCLFPLCVCVCVGVCARMPVHTYACMHVCVRERVHVHVLVNAVVFELLLCWLSLTFLIVQHNSMGCDWLFCFLLLVGLLLLCLVRLPFGKPLHLYA